MRKKVYEPIKLIVYKYKTLPVARAVELLPLFPHTSLLQVEAGEAHIKMECQKQI